ncbi:MAG: CDP-alcohol phosphatidyltransferase family protein [Bacilli bacterium]|nr:CDP-alcohol phosphatidyltransferase family protein [Bacilli bacterium]
MNFFKKNAANLITLIRIFGAIALIMLEPLSLPFFIVYGVCGLSDAFDGLVARKLGIQSSFGSALDSLSDLLFYGVMAAKMFPTFQRLLLPYQWVIIAVPTALHFIAYIICAIKFSRFSAIHTYANKALGLLVYLFPFFFIGEIPLLWTIYMIVGGVIALYGSVEINLIHIIAKRYDTRNKSVFFIRRNENTPIEEDK